MSFSGLPMSPSNSIFSEPTKQKNFLMEVSALTGGKISTEQAFVKICNDSELSILFFLKTVKIPPEILSQIKSKFLSPDTTTT